jgi:hypothetical protein
MEIYTQVVAANIPLANHESDLYIPVTDETRALIAAYRFKENVTTFINNLDGKLWYDVPFAFLPYWEAKQR